jgi:hypothetical protein
MLLTASLFPNRFVKPVACVVFNTTKQAGSWQTTRSHLADEGGPKQARPVVRVVRRKTKAVGCVLCGRRGFSSEAQRKLSERRPWLSMTGDLAQSQLTRSTCERAAN